jgi:hypothetical protein
LACYGASINCVATGALISGVNASAKQVAFSFNGSKWRTVPIAVPAWSTPYGGKTNLWSVSCQAPKNCVAVGDVPGSSKPAIIDLYNGTKWTLSHGSWPPHEASNLVSVSCHGTGFCLAWGNSSQTACQCEPPNLVEQWTGSAWKTVGTPAATTTTGIIAGQVSCVSKMYCIAVGDNYVNTTGGASRWDGSKWHTTKVASAGVHSLLWSVSCATDTSCMAVGSSGPSGSPKPLAEWWNGSKWALQHLPAGSAQTLSEVSCPDSKDCIAVSGDAVLAHPVIDKWNGTKWTKLSPATNPSGDSATHLTTISCVTKASCFAMGSQQPKSGNAQLLSEKWNGTSWSIVSLP